MSATLVRNTEGSRMHSKRLERFDLFCQGSGERTGGSSPVGSVGQRIALAVSSMIAECSRIYLLATSSSERTECSYEANEVSGAEADLRL